MASPGAFLIAYPPIHQLQCYSECKKLMGGRGYAKGSYRGRLYASKQWNCAATLEIVCPAHTCRAGYTEVTLKLAISCHFHAIHGGQPPSVLRIQGAEMSSSQIGLRTSKWCVFFCKSQRMDVVTAAPSHGWMALVFEVATHWCVITWLHGGAEVTRWPDDAQAAFFRRRYPWTGSFIQVFSALHIFSSSCFELKYIANTKIWVILIKIPWTSMKHPFPQSAVKTLPIT